MMVCTKKWDQFEEERNYIIDGSWDNRDTAKKKSEFLGMLVTWHLEFVQAWWIVLASICGYVRIASEVMLYCFWNWEWDMWCLSVPVALVRLVSAVALLILQCYIVIFGCIQWFIFMYLPYFSGSKYPISRVQNCVKLEQVKKIQDQTGICSKRLMRWENAQIVTVWSQMERDNIWLK
jgi:hypothetical protein